MSRILIPFATVDGQAARIAERFVEGQRTGSPRSDRGL